MWKIFHVGDANPISLRAISPKGRTAELRPKNITLTAAAYPCVEERKRAFERHAIELNDGGYNAYIVMNAISPLFDGCDRDRPGVRDNDIVARHLLLIDLDRRDALVAPATDDEVIAATDAAKRIESFLYTRLGVRPFRLMSGNGVHLYLPLASLPNTTETTARCQRMLTALGRQFNTDQVKVDTAVYNAARITKVPGTIARRGEESAGRAYRMAQVIS